MPPNTTNADPGPPRLRRELGLFGATMLGLGSVVGTGVFVSVGVAAGVAGSGVVLAVVLGAVVAGFNGLSSAQLAAYHPVSGGTYEYGYAFLNPTLGFVAGWTFLLAKSASAASAALGFAGYVLAVSGAPQAWRTAVALSAVTALTLMVLSGLRRSNLANTVIVSLTLLSLLVFIVAGTPTALTNAGVNLDLSGATDLRALLYATALMFVAYTGYGRIATLGEEVKDPPRTVPRAIIVTLLVTMTLYALVAVVGVGAVGASALGEPGNRAAPLERAAVSFGVGFVPEIVTFGAVTALLGVLLNLVLGLSRVLLAMARRRDVPFALAKLEPQGKTPTRAVVAVGVGVGALTLLGDVKTTWSFSAFAVLVYYAITNLAALYLPAAGRRFPTWFSAAGLVACLGLAFFVEQRVWLAGVAAIAVGLVWHRVARRLGG